MIKVKILLKVQDQSRGREEFIFKLSSWKKKLKFYEEN